MPHQTIHSYQYVEQFKCIQDKCEASCCQENWVVPVTNSEVDFYRKNAPDIHEIIVSDKGVNKIPSGELNACMFLSDGKCKIHAERGPKLLPEGCHDYPRVYRSINDILFRSAKISCPEVTRICLFSDKPFESKQLTKVDTDVGPVYNFDVPRLSNANALSTTDILLSKILEEDKAVEQTLYAVLLATYAMDVTKVEDWKTTIEKIFLHCDENPFNSQFHKNNNQQPIIPLLKDTIFKVSNFPENILEKFNSMLLLTSRNEDNIANVALDTHHLSSYQGETFLKINHILRRYIANNMTLASLPIIPLTEKGKSAGKRASHWGQFLVIDFLITRLLLISAISNDGKPPKDNVTVEIIFRLARYKMHANQSKSEAQLINMGKDNFLEIVHTLL